MAEWYRLPAPILVLAVKVGEKNWDELESIGSPETMTILTHYNVINRVMVRHPIMGLSEAGVGDYVIKGPDGNLFVSKGVMFEMYYEKVDTPVGNNVR